MTPAMHLQVEPMCSSVRTQVNYQSVLIVKPDTLLIEIIIFMDAATGRLTVEDLGDKSINTEVEASTAQAGIDCKDCVLVMDSGLVGMVTRQDVEREITRRNNLAEVTIAEVMTQPVITIKESELANMGPILTLMAQNCLSHLPIVDDGGQILGIVTPVSLAKVLHAELVETRAKWQTAEHKLASLHIANESLRQEISKRQAALRDRAATEAQLLQTTSELQEIFQAFPDIYLRLRSDGKVLSFHGGQAAKTDFSLEAWIGKNLQDILPSPVGYQFQQAILQVQQTNSLVALEYSLSTTAGERNFEARFLPSLHSQIIVIIRDITDQQHALIALKESEEALQAAKEQLEIRVTERTEELSNANRRLRQQIVERQRIEKALRYRVELEKLITTISNHFINLAPQQIDNGINQALQTLGSFTKIDRIYVYLFNDNCTKIDNTHEWCAKGVEPHIAKLKAVSVEIFPWLATNIKQGKSVYIPNVAKLPIAASIEREILAYQGIKSMMCVPILCAGSVIGWLGFDAIRSHTTWTEDSIAMLKVVGEIFANALERQRVEAALSISQERYARAISAGKVGVWEWDIKSNKIYIDANLKAMLGYGDNEINNHFDDWMRFVYPDDKPLVLAEIKAHLDGLTSQYEIEHRRLHKDGSIRWFLARGTVINDANGKSCCMAGSDTDITEHKQAESQIKLSLKEKEVLLKEIHHRVKNNLQVISSLLRLQAKYIKDEKALDIFQDSQNRVRAMALIHENLYQSNDLATINFLEYVRKLTNNLLRSYGVKSRNIKIELKIDNALVKLDTAIPCGLIINELVSNSIKHAFNNHELGIIIVEFSTFAHNKYSLTVGDNSIGIPKDLDLRKTESLGLQLVWNLVEQLEGSIAVNTKDGTLFIITFSEVTQ